MSKMLCCGGEKDSGRDLKSAQNTPSRQPLSMPFGNSANAANAHAQQQKGLAPPPLAQQQPGPGQGPPQPPQAMGVGPLGGGPGQLMPPGAGGPGGGHQPGRIPVPAFDHRDEFKKVCHVAR